MCAKAQFSARSSRPTSQVWSVRADGYAYREISRAIAELFGAITPHLASIIKPGDRVLVKPFLTHMGSSNPERRWVSHPIFVRCVVEAVRDCGARVELGDVRLAPRNSPMAPDKRWIYELARETGAQPVSFARAGLVKVKSGILYPRHFYVSRAVLEADLVVNCANAVAQDGLLLSGAMRNMFNAIASGQQDLIYRLRDSRVDLAEAIARVFAIAPPAISLLDMVTIREPGQHGQLRHVGAILGGPDAIAIDTAAKAILGYGEEALWTSVAGARLGLGCADLDRIELIGPKIADLAQTNFPLPLLHPMPMKRTAPELAQRALRHILISQKPTIRAASCTQCRDCIDLCPVRAITDRGKEGPVIDPSVCIDCGSCAAVCPSHAIHPAPLGLSRWWNQAKTGASIGIGPLRVHVRLSRNTRLGRPLRGNGRGPSRRVAMLEADRATRETQIAPSAQATGRE